MDASRVAMVVMELYMGIVFVRSARAASSPSTHRESPQPAVEASEQNRIERADGERERKDVRARYAVAVIAFCMAAALLANLVSIAIGYAIFCLAVVGRAVADQLAEERAPRRRSALLGRVRRVDPVLVAWMALAGAASLVLVPWIMNGAYRASAGVVAFCVLVMLGIAWRIASAPPLLFGSDIEAEEAVDRETRAIRTGNTCVIALAAVWMFMAFAGEELRFAIPVTLVIVALFAWKKIYAHRLSHAPLTS